MKLENFFKNNPKAAIAFSGGVDSAYLLYAAMTFGAEVKAYYVASEFQPEVEKRDALRLAEELGTDIQILPLQVLCDQNVRANPSDRCYYCKKQIFSAIVKAAAEDGFSLILDGSNASDDAGDRPGMRVLQEMSVRSPLRECQGSRVIYMGQTGLCLSCYKNPNRRGNHNRKNANHRACGGLPVLPWTYGFSGAFPKRSCTVAGTGKADSDGTFPSNGYS